jgi:hypothetical protein
MTTVLELGRNLALTELGTRGILPGTPLSNRARWNTELAARWATETGWVVGCNFTPSSASNQLEMWQADTFDPETIGRELGWAADIGMNSIRLFLHDLMWVLEGEAFLHRVDRVMDIAAGHGISVMPVLFDGIWDPEPRPGPQRAPRRGVHNSTWVQGPGAAVVADRSRWDSLRPYVDGVMERFGTDERIVAWDLFNEPDSPNPAYLRRDPTRKRQRIADLLELVWDWAAEVDPSQPLTVGVYLKPWAPHPERASRVARTALERSDIISFHCYEPEPVLQRAIDGLRSLGRPLVCTEWMARPTSPPALIEVFRRTGVGCYTWGLVDGRSQTKYPWSSWVRRSTDRTPWFHELLHPDGTPYDHEEKELFRRATGHSTPESERRRRRYPRRS